jgi:hypothetical protein
MRQLTDPNLIDKVVITLTPEKACLVHAQAKWRDRFSFAFTYFDSGYFEWPGSILSAAHLFGPFNLVLLPDSNLVALPDKPIVSAALDLLQTDACDVVLAVVRETDPARLRCLGALWVDDDGTVTRFADKPQADLHLYNAFWTAFAFKGAVGRPLLELMTESVQKVPVDLGRVGRVRAFYVQSYEDLGTWPNLQTYHHRVGYGVTALEGITL